MSTGDEIDWDTCDEQGTEVYLSRCGRFEARHAEGEAYLRLHPAGDPAQSYGEAPSLSALTVIAEAL